MSPPLLDAGDVRAAWARVGAGGVGGERVVRVTRNPSERGVRHRAGAGRGEQRPDMGLGLDIRALACPHPPPIKFHRYQILVYTKLLPLSPA